MPSLNTQKIEHSKTDTEVAVLQVRIGNVEEKINNIFTDIKEDMKNIDTKLDKSQQTLKEVHANLEKKISALEKWSWMIMGAGVVIGYLGIDSVLKLFQ